MFLREILEGAVQIFGRSGNKTVRKYRCTTGSRKGRIVAKPSTCTKPKNIKQSVTMKRTRAKKTSPISIRAAQTKRSNPVSQRLKKLNVGSRRLKPRRKTR